MSPTQQLTNTRSPPHGQSPSRTVNLVDDACPANAPTVQRADGPTGGIASNVSLTTLRTLFRSLLLHTLLGRLFLHTLFGRLLLSTFLGCLLFN